MRRWIKLTFEQGSTSIDADKVVAVETFAHKSFPWAHATVYAGETSCLVAETHDEVMALINPPPFHQTAEYHRALQNQQ